MKITKIKHIATDTLAAAIINAFHDTRFLITVFSRHDLVNIQQVRLRASKAYCGSHPCGCEGDPKKRDKKAAHLEGADWVEFNDRLNTVLDGLGAHARIESSQVHLREAGKRRVVYTQDRLLGVPGFNAAWT